MAGVLGADLVGMSTTLEAIAAREAGMEILGLSLVTNLAAGMTGEALNHEEVLEAGKMAAERMGGLLATVVGSCDPRGPAAADDGRAVGRCRPRPGDRSRAHRPDHRRRGGRPRGRDGAADAFAGTLQFGTAGLRGKLGPGPNRMNRVVVSRAAAGLAQYLLDQGQGGTRLSSADARYNSDVFARDTAEIFAGAGFRARSAPGRCPRPSWPARSSPTGPRRVWS